jgi:putative endonuclease
VDQTPNEEGRRNRRAHYWRGHVSEWIGALLLFTTGYRILARRVKTPAGEIDLVVARGKLIAFVEVKLRPTMEEAEAAITPRQRLRIQRAAELWMARRPRFYDHEIRFDVVFLVPWRWPRHIKGGL